MTETTTVSAGSNPDLANSLVEKALADTAPPVEPAQIILPFNNVVVLPSGYISPDGALHKEVEVRELNGVDEEALSKIDTLVKMWSAILSRGVVRVGAFPATEAILDDLLIGDRDALVLGIYKATFGRMSNIDSFCSGCKDYKTVQFDVDADLNMKLLADPIQNRTFKVYGVKNEYLVTLPTGFVAKELSSDQNRTDAEIKSVMLENCILEINNQPVVSKLQIKGLGIADRSKIFIEIMNRAPGPQFDDITIDCPDCGGKVVVPVSLGAIFRY